MYSGSLICSLRRISSNRSVCFSQVVARHNNKSAIRKLLFEKKAQILSDVAKIHEEHFQAFYKYSLHLCFIAGASTQKMSNEHAQAIHGALLVNQLNEATHLRLLMAQKIPETIYAQSQLMLLGDVTRPWVNPLLSRERRGRFLASAASMTNVSSRASHKTDRSRGWSQTQKSDKALVNTGGGELRTLPRVGRGVGIP
ncbi:MAG: hypothetical protein P4N60_00675 [Verrucomicrobiae bacterium]|nr:hypothetical protein [Verrucomicrobiae bacterium]